MKISKVALAVDEAIEDSRYKAQAVEEAKKWSKGKPGILSRLKSRIKFAFS